MTVKKDGKHEPYCGCHDCKRPEPSLPLLERKQEREPEKQGLPKEAKATG
jgi:hypothetical protein